MLLACLALSPFASSATTAFHEGWENGTAGWETWRGNPAAVDCTKGFGGGCALAWGDTRGGCEFCKFHLVRPVMGYALEGSAFTMSFRLRLASFEGVEFTASAATDGNPIAFYSWDGTGSGTGATSNRIFLQGPSAYPDLSVVIPSRNVYYTIALKVRADGYAEYSLLDASGARIQSHPPAYFPIREIADFQISGGGRHPANVMFLDDLTISGEVGAIGPPSPPQNARLKTSRDASDLLAGREEPANGQAILTWDAPATDGHRPLAHYTVTRTGAGASAAVVYQGLAREFRDAGLSTGSYTYAITATNERGTSAAATASGWVLNTGGLVPG